MSRLFSASLLSIVLIAGCGSAATSPDGSSTPGASTPPTSLLATPSPSPLPAPTPTPDPLALLTWQSLGTIPSPDIRGVVGSDHGYVAVDSTLTTWFSPDGAKWEAVKLPFKVKKNSDGDKLEADVQAITTDGTRVLIVGAYAHEPCRSGPGLTGGGPGCPLAPLAWISDDGRTWTSAYPGPLPADPKGYDQGSEFVAAWPVPTGGWDAALSYWNGESLHGRDLMHSADGLKWTALEPAPKAVTNDSDPFPWTHAGVADGTGLRLLWQGWADFTREPFSSGAGRPTFTLATSPDGRTWTAIDGFDGKDVEVTAGLAPTADPSSPWILAGASGFADELTSVPTIWTSTDTSAWTAAVLPTPNGLIATPSGVLVRSVQSLVHAAIGYVAVAAASDGEQADQATWLSHDGVTWTAMAHPWSGSVFGPGIVADGPAAIIGIGPDQADSEHAVEVWQLR